MHTFVKGTSMTISQATVDDMCGKLRMVGLNKELVLSIVNALTKQVSAEGPENVVKRLKVLKQAAVNHLAGQPHTLPWIRHDGLGRPKGPWGKLWDALSSRSYRHQRRALNAMMVYACLVLPKRASPTSTQERKFLSSVAIPEDQLRVADQLAARATERGVFRKGFVTLSGTLAHLGWKPDSRYDDDSFTEIFEYLARTYGTDPLTVQSAEKRVEVFLGQDAGRPFHAFPQVKHVLGEVGEDYFSMTHPWNGAHWDWRKAEPPEEPIGVVGSTQEPGYKFRAFAAPNWVLQCALERLKRSLLRALELLPWDCTHDQEAGVTQVQKWLLEGKTCFSVDLTDATNHFPLDFQLDVLRHLRVPEEDIKLMEMVARSPYKVMWRPGQQVTWTRGQPLGAGPSFMCFALAHAVVALDAELEAWPKSQPGEHFLILGDDFITNDWKLHAAYRRRLKALSCPVSEGKCLSSSSAGEFAGKVILKDRVFHGYKYREVSDVSVIPTIHNLGRQALSKKLLTKPQYDYAKLVQELPFPTGLGFNPKGRPLADRWEEALVLIDQKELRRQPLEQFRPEEVRAKFVYNLIHRHWRYYTASRPDPSDPVSARADAVNRRIDCMIRWSDVLIPFSNKRGDPRTSPLEGWNRRMIREVTPVIIALREKQAAAHAEKLGQTRSSGNHVVSDPRTSGGQTTSERTGTGKPRVTEAPTPPNKRRRPAGSSPGW